MRAEPVIVALSLVLGQTPAGAADLLDPQLVAPSRPVDLLGAPRTQVSSDDGTLRAELLGVVQAPAGELWPALGLFGSQHAWVPYMRGAEVTGIDDGTATCAGQVNLPWPLKDRAFRVHMTAVSVGDRFEARWSYVPGSGDLDDTFGVWTLQPAGPELTLVRLVAVAKLDQGVPGPLLRWAERRALPRMLDALESQRSR